MQVTGLRSELAAGVAAATTGRQELASTLQNGVVSHFMHMRGLAVVYGPPCASLGFGFRPALPHVP